MNGNGDPPNLKKKEVKRDGEVKKNKMMKTRTWQHKEVGDVTFNFGNQIQTRRINFVTNWAKLDKTSQAGLGIGPS